MKPFQIVFLILALLLAQVSLPVYAGEIPKFRHLVVDDNSFEPYAIRAADINGDKRPDLVVVGEKEVVWYENPGPEALAGEKPIWKKRLITKEPNRNVTAALADVNGDGKLDIAIGADWYFGQTNKPSSLWYGERDPSGDLDKPWMMRKLPFNDPTIHRIYFCDTDGDKKQELLVAPLQGRGSTKEKNWMDAAIRLVLLHPPKETMKDEWRLEVVDDQSLHMCHNLIAEEGRIITASTEGLTVFHPPKNSEWFRFPAIGRIKKISAASETKLGNTFYCATIEPFHGNQLVIYSVFSRKGVAAKDPEDLRRILDDSLQEGHGLVCADLNADGIDEVIAGFRGGKGGLRVYSPDENWAVWTRTLLDEGTINVEDADTADFDGDGRPDLVACGRASHNVKVYLNTGKP